MELAVQQAAVLSAISPVPEMPDVWAIDQLQVAAHRLRENPRRAVIAVFCDDAEIARAWRRCMKPAA